MALQAAPRAARRVQAGARGQQFGRIMQNSWASGMYRTGDPALAPPDSCFDALNTLIEATGGPYRRGGTSYRSSGAFGGGLRMIWDGWLLNGQNTIIASTTEYGRLNLGGTVTALGAPGSTVPNRPVAMKGIVYLPGGKQYDGTTYGAAPKISNYYAVAGSRLWAVEGADKILFSKINEPSNFAATDYHQLPGGVEILGLEGGREDVYVFTTSGLWIISNVGLNLVDANGNVQHRLDHFSNDLILWGNAGIASWEHALIVPGTACVWLLRRGTTSEAPQSFMCINDPIMDLYMEYVRLGYEPGQAAVHRAHYFLPIIGNGRVADLLVCRLDLKQMPWTRLGGFGAEVACLWPRISATSARQPELIAGHYTSSSRMLNCSYLTPSEGTQTDADGSVPEWGLTTRSVATGNLVPNLVRQIRVRYNMSSPEASPKMRCELAGDTPLVGAASIWGRFTWGSAAAWDSPSEATLEEVPGGEAPPSEDARQPFSWFPNKKRRFIRIRFVVKTKTAQLKLRQLDLFVRAEGRD